jgi:hypothetical protein
MLQNFDCYNAKTLGTFFYFFQLLFYPIVPPPQHGVHKLDFFHDSINRLKIKGKTFTFLYGVGRSNAE